METVQLFNKNFKAMKTILLIAMCLAFFAVVQGQEREINPGQSDITPPEFHGKNFEMFTQDKPCASLNDYLRGCACYPDESIKRRVEGTEVVEFVVTPEGKLTAFYVINSLSPEIDAHVISLLEKTSGMWSPCRIDNKVVPMRSEVSIVFKWNEFEELKAADFPEKAKIHFDKGSRQLLVLRKPEKAIKHFNAGIRYLPKDESLLMIRGICRYELGDENGALNDWERMKALENSRSKFQQYAESLYEFKGYELLSDLVIQ
jgi:tetratricopeptide (TPR) repeat protein